MLVTLVGNCSDSRQGARHEGSTALVRGAKFCSVPVKEGLLEGLSSMVLTTGLLTAAASSLVTKLWAVASVFGGKEVNHCLAEN